MLMLMLNLAPGPRSVPAPCLLLGGGLFSLYCLRVSCSSTGATGRSFTEGQRQRQSRRGRTPNRCFRPTLFSKYIITNTLCDPSGIGNFCSAPREVPPRPLLLLLLMIFLEHIQAPSLPERLQVQGLDSLLHHRWSSHV